MISATHQDLPQAIADGHFREDLYYRIKGVQLTVPLLRQRREDTVLLAQFFLEREANRHQRTPPTLGRDAVDAVMGHAWPGNVRELENAIAAAVAMAERSEIRPSDLGLAPTPEVPLEAEMADLLGLSLTDAKSRLVESFERRAIMDALERHEGNVSAAARQLGIHRQSLQQKMTQWGIVREGKK